MAIEPKKVNVTPDTKLEVVTREAENAPVFFEMNGRTYELTSSPYTISSAYNSIVTVDGRRGAEISDEELEDIIEAAKRANARHVLEGLEEE